MPNDTIVIKAPAGTKARWVRQSQAQGEKLSDWIIERVERQEQPMQIIIPAVPFAALQLARDPQTGSVSFDLDVVAQIERASGLQAGHFTTQPEDALAEVITRWYAAHLQAGGDRDPVADDLIAEVRAEDAAGQPYSHQPGRA